MTIEEDILNVISLVVLFVLIYSLSHLVEIMEVLRSLLMPNILLGMLFFVFLSGTWLGIALSNKEGI